MTTKTEIRTREHLLNERNEAIMTLRSVCKTFGDNDWPYELHLSDIIDKHLARYLFATVTDSAQEQAVELGAQRDQHTLKSVSLPSSVAQAREKLYDYMRTAQDKREGKVDPDFARDVDALIAASSQASDWQPIETAPKDGTLFVAAGYYFAFHAYFDLAEDWQCWRAQTGEMFGAMKHMPTHWTPLPAPVRKPEKARGDRE